MKQFTPHLRQHDLSAQQWRVLRALYDREVAGEPQIEMKALAEQCFLLMPSLSRIAQHLDQRGLIQREASKTDQRRSMIRLSEDGKKLVELMSPQSEARYQRITEVFGYGKLELLYELLDELTEKLADDSADDHN